MGGPVHWATGPDPAPVWLDIAREYMERYVHQQQIRDTTGRAALDARFTYPVLAAAAHALPRALAGIARPDGTVVTFTADGAGGGSWYLLRRGDGWQLGDTGPPPPPACAVRTSVAGAIKLYARDPTAPPLVRRGDPALAGALSQVKAVLG
jgi:hypothetical protein